MRLGLGDLLLGGQVLPNSIGTGDGGGCRNVD